MFNQGRMARERNTFQSMVRIYCRDHHAPTHGLCEGCQNLVDYAMERLDRCPFQEGKTTCAKCPIHCYRPEMRERVRIVMRYAGPRMILRHPLLAIYHLVDGKREEPIRP